MQQVKEKTPPADKSKVLTIPVEKKAVEINIPAEMQSGISAIKIEIEQIQAQFQQQLQTAIAPYNARISGLVEGLAISKGISVSEGGRITISEDNSTLIIEPRKSN